MRNESITEQLDAHAVTRDIAREFAQDAAESRRLDKTLDYLLGEHSQLHPIGVPNIRDLCFTVFMRAKNEGTDWFNDMLPTVEAGIEKMRRFADRPEPSR
jgi:hypothetical protein